METFLKISLGIHVFAGFTALVTAPVALMFTKGSQQHRIWGKIYFWAMTIVAISALLIASFKFIPFLLMLSIFSYYAVIRGYRALYLKQLHLGQKPALIDWITGGITLLFSIGLVLWGLELYLKQGFGFSIVSFVFGGVGITSVISDFKLFYQPPKDRMHWFYDHISGMLGGYIATVTAFSATNLTFMPALYRWLLPIIIGVPLISITIRRYRKKFNAEKPISSPEKILKEVID